MAGRLSKDAGKKGVQGSPSKRHPGFAKDDWLSLKISENTGSGKDPLKPAKSAVFISIPKKVVPLATRRNRLKRLIREVVRKEVFFKDRNKVYFFRTLALPEGLDFWVVERKIRECIESL